MQLATVSTGASAPVRLFELLGDSFEPNLRSHDFLLVAQVDRYQYETTYLLDFGFGEAPFIAHAWPGRRVAIHHPNPKYSRQEISLDEFNAAVTAMVVGEVRVKDRSYVLQVAQRRAA
jgi:hypothetical protein